MPLFTLVSLVLALFGATYTAIAAVYRAFEDSFKKTLADAEVGIQVVHNSCPEDTKTHKHSKRLHVAMCVLRRLWTYVRAVPAIIFVVVAYYIAGCAVFDWKDMSANTPNPADFPWWTFPHMFKWMFWTHLASLLASLLIYASCRFLGHMLKTRSETLRDGQADKLARPPSPISHPVRFSESAPAAPVIAESPAPASSPPPVT